MGGTQTRYFKLIYEENLYFIEETSRKRHIQMPPESTALNTFECISLKNSERSEIENLIERPEYSVLKDCVVLDKVLYFYFFSTDNEKHQKYELHWLDLKNKRNFGKSIELNDIISVTIGCYSFLISDQKSKKLYIIENNNESLFVHHIEKEKFVKTQTVKFEADVTEFHLNLICDMFFNSDVNPTFLQISIKVSSLLCIKNLTKVFFFFSSKLFPASNHSE